MKGIILFTLFAIGMTASAQRVNFGNHQLSINGDDMTWLLQTDGSQYEWVTDKYQWGNAYYDADGDIAAKTERRQEGDDLVETYVFTNTSKRKVAMKNIGIYTPFNDNYPDARTCMTSRCNVHIWPGGKAACAFVYPRLVNGEPAHYADAYANDQDWALIFYLLVNGITK